VLLSSVSLFLPSTLSLHSSLPALACHENSFTYIPRWSHFSVDAVHKKILNFFFPRCLTFICKHIKQILSIMPRRNINVMAWKNWIKFNSCALSRNNNKHNLPVLSVIGFTPCLGFSCVNYKSFSLKFDAHKISLTSLEKVSGQVNHKKIVS
jgi:hypothetical protein